jgi:hypothetical protein
MRESAQFQLSITLVATETMLENAHNSAHDDAMLSKPDIDAKISGSRGSQASRLRIFISSTPGDATGFLLR